MLSTQALLIAQAQLVALAIQVCRLFPMFTQTCCFHFREKRFSGTDHP